MVFLVLRRFLLLLCCCLPLGAGAACPEHPLTDPARVRLKGESVMIVTHASSTYDARYTSKRGVDEAVRFARQQGIPVIYLQDDSPLAFYYMEDCRPDYWVHSGGGEFSFPLPVSHVYLVGGHLELCLSATLNDILLAWSRQAPGTRRITLFMDGIYSNGKSVEPEDPFYGDFQRFMGIVTRGRPQGEHWPKLNLLETMGVIQQEEHELEYLKKVLPRYDTTLPDYRVELQLNDSVLKVLQPADGWKPPTLRFHFLDSAANLDFPAHP